MYHNIELKEGAFVISDAHYSHQRPQLLNFLKAIHSKKLRPTQLILMGDIFDTLFGCVAYTQEINREAIDILNNISIEIEVIYLEGNHDFQLSKIFPNAKIFTIQEQPLIAKYNGKVILLAHGDIDNTFIYKVYTALIRNSALMSFLNIIDSILGHFIMNRLDNYLSKKEDCKRFIGFREFIQERLVGRYSCNYFIEGHFHQNKTLEYKEFIYINLAAFACNQRYFIVKSSQEVDLLEEDSFFIRD